MKLSNQLLHALGAWLVLGLVMCLTKPGSLPVVFLIVPFVMLYYAIFTSWKLIMNSRAKYRGEATSSHHRLGAAVSTSLVMLIILQSLGQLTVRDVLTVAAIVAIGYLYVSRTKFSPRRQ